MSSKLGTKFKSSSECGIGACIEARKIPRRNRVEIRESENPRNVLSVSFSGWRIFLKAIKNEEFDIE